MAYEKQVWVDDAKGRPGTPVDAAHLNHIEEGIANVELTPGPKGDKGDKGDTGATGPKGATGAAGPTYTLPAATTGALGGVKMAASVSNVAANADAAAIAAAVNGLLVSLRAAGVVASH